MDDGSTPSSNHRKKELPFANYLLSNLSLREALTAEVGRDRPGRAPKAYLDCEYLFRGGWLLSHNDCSERSY